MRAAGSRDVRRVPHWRPHRRGHAPPATAKPGPLDQAASSRYISEVCVPIAPHKHSGIDAVDPWFPSIAAHLRFACREAPRSIQGVALHSLPT